MARNRKPSSKPADALQTDPGVTELISAIIANAERCAEDVVCLIAEWRKTLPSFADRPLTAGALHQLGALVDLARWERGGVTRHLKASVPPASAVLAEAISPVIGRDVPRYEGTALARELFAIRFTELAWTPMPAQADVVVSPTMQSHGLVDDLAEFLWRFRHLAAGHHKE